MKLTTLIGGLMLASPLAADDVSDNAYLDALTSERRGFMLGALEVREAKFTKDAGFVFGQAEIVVKCITEATSTVAFEKCEERWTNITKRGLELTVTSPNLYAVCANLRSHDDCIWLMAKGGAVSVVNRAMLATYDDAQSTLKLLGL